jgi:hypothetical protein
MSYQEIAKIEEPLKKKNQTSVLKNYWQKLFEINANSPPLAYNYPKAQLYPLN